MDFAAAVAKIAETHPSKIILFIGSGLNLELGFPSWKGLVEELDKVCREFSTDLSNVMKRRLAAGDLVGAASLAYEKEVPANYRAKALLTLFGRSKVSLESVHRDIGSLPVAAFLTTNFDSVIEQAIEAGGRHAEPYSGADRFGRFNSQLPLYSEGFSNNVEGKALVLKVHSDTTDCENMVISEAHFNHLSSAPGFKALYETTLKNFCIVFLGFSGNDPNLRRSIASVVSDYVGYGWSDSFLFLPENDHDAGTEIHEPVHVVRYDPANNHAAICDAVKNWKREWTRRLRIDETNAQRDGIPPDLRAFQDAVDSADPNRTNIFELLIPTFKAKGNDRILDVVASTMVCHAKIAASPHNDRHSIADRLAHKFSLSPARALSLVDKYAGTGYSPPDCQQPQVDPRQVLAMGLLYRCKANDPDFLISVEQLVPVVRSTVEYGLQAFGCSVALAIVSGDRPSQTELAEIIRTVIERREWMGIGAFDRETLSLAIPDLFIRPSEEESSIISRLAVTATAFGLIQSLPEVGQVVDRPIVYLDTNCVLPLVTTAEPRYSAIRPLVSLTDATSGMRCLSTFVTEVKQHYDNARQLLERHRLKTVSDLTEFLGSGLEEFFNLFLLQIAQGGYEPSAKISVVLEHSYKNPSTSKFRRLIEDAGVLVVEPPSDLDRSRLEDLAQFIFSRKRNWYDRTPDVRARLAKNEATQLLTIERDISEGRAAWFASGDGQLRRLIRMKGDAYGKFVLPVAGMVTILQSLTSGTELARSYPRALWSPNVYDDIDQQVGVEIREMLDSLPSGERPPIEESRRLAHEAYLAAQQEQGDGDDPSALSGHMEIQKIVKDSVFRSIGQRIELDGRDKHRKD